MCHVTFENVSDLNPDFWIQLAGPPPDQMKKLHQSPHTSATTEDTS